MVPNGSPFEADKPEVRLNLAVARVVESGLPLVYLNQVGGQDELVFDGGSFVLNADRSLAVRLPEFRSVLAVTHWTRSNDRWTCAAQKPAPEPARLGGERKLRVLSWGGAFYTQFILEFFRPLNPAMLPDAPTTAPKVVREQGA